jgi:hypothetical protein
MDDMTPPRGWHSRGYLPHFDGGSVPQTVCFRLADSIPSDRLESLENELACFSRVKAGSFGRRTILTGTFETDGILPQHLIT